MLDIVTLIRYMTGTVTSCESGPSTCCGGARLADERAGWRQAASALFVTQRLGGKDKRDEEEAAERTLETKGATERITLVAAVVRRRGRTVDARSPR